MNKIAICLMGLLFVAGCVDFDTTGIEEIDSLTNELALSTRVSNVACEAYVFSNAAPTTAQCFAFNDAGTVITYYGQSLVKWTSSDVSIIKVTLDGIISPNGYAGNAYIRAEGSFNSIDSTLVTVN